MNFENITFDMYSFAIEEPDNDIYQNKNNSMKLNITQEGRDFDIDQALK